ncbi:MAG: peptidylprolyl isomerase, partial [Nitrospira sp.]|nr:peptidylprolyl isomerase [Nitrospira sp.]
MLLFMTGEAFAESSVADLCGVPLPSIVAKVNDSEILRGEVFLRLGDIATLSQDQRRSRCRGAAEEAIRAVLLTPEAESYQVRVEPEEVEAKLNGFKASFPSEEAFEGFLAERQADLSSLKKMIRDRLLLERFEEREIKSWAFSEELQEEYFKQHRQELTKDRIKVSHILVKTRQDAEQILQERNLKNRSFSELAVKYSQDSKSRESGGDLGWIERGKMPPEFDAAAFSLEINMISKPVKSPLGYHL